MEPPTAATPPSLTPASSPTCDWSIERMEAADWLTVTHRTPETEAHHGPGQGEPRHRHGGAVVRPRLAVDLYFLSVRGLGGSRGRAEENVILGVEIHRVLTGNVMMGSCKMIQIKLPSGLIKTLDCCRLLVSFKINEAALHDIIHDTTESQPGTLLLCVGTPSAWVVFTCKLDTR